MKAISILLLSLFFASSAAFVVLSTVSSRSSSTSLSAQISSRAGFLRDVATTSIASVLVTLPRIASAEDAEELLMPTADEQKVQDEAAYQERLRRKAELQKQARKPMGYAESMEAEKRKQQSLQKTKEEKRIALCEELGRGC